MYCKKCGSQIEDNSNFCKSCGTKVIFEESETSYEISQELIQEKSYIENNDVTSTKKNQPSLRWYKVLINFLIPATLILRPIESFGNLHLQVEQFYGSWKGYFTHPIDGFPNTLNIMVWLFGMSLLLFAYRGIKKFTELGYKYIIAFFIFNICYPIISALIYSSSFIKAGIDYNYGPTFAQIIINSIVSIPNIIYFKKRKYLFDDIKIHNL